LLREKYLEIEENWNKKILFLENIAKDFKVNGAEKGNLLSVRDRIKYSVK